MQAGQWHDEKSVDLSTLARNVDIKNMAALSVRDRRDIHKLPFPIKVKMPCGREFWFETAADVPPETTPCPCGTERRWVVIYGGFPQ